MLNEALDSSDHRNKNLVSMLCGVAPMKHRRRITQTQSLEERLAAQAKRLREEAQLLAPGPLREEMLRRARQAETGAHMTEWLTSPGLQPPE